MQNIYNIIEEEYRSYKFRNRTLDTYSSYLFEERKISDEVNDVTKAITDIFLEKNYDLTLQEKTDGKVYFKYMTNIDIGNNFFMQYPTVLVKIILSDKLAKSNSSISPSNEELFVNNKLNSPVIIITHYNTKPVIDEMLFTNALSHEVMHGYRLLNIHLQNKSSKQTKKQKVKPSYDVYSDFNVNDSFAERFAKEAYYLTDINEINSNAAAEVNYILKNKNINFTNYKEYLNDIPFYDKVSEIRNKLTTLDNLIKKNENYKVVFGKVISKLLYKNKYNDYPIVAFNKMYNRLQRGYTYCVRRFYDVLWSTLERDNRIRSIEPTMYVTSEELERELKDIKL